MKRKNDFFQDDTSKRPRHEMEPRVETLPVAQPNLVEWQDDKDDLDKFVASWSILKKGSKIDTTAKCFSRLFEVCFIESVKKTTKEARVFYIVNSILNIQKNIKNQKVKKNFVDEVIHSKLNQQVKYSLLMLFHYSKDDINQIVRNSFFGGSTLPRSGRFDDKMVDLTIDHLDDIKRMLIPKQFTIFNNQITANLEQRQLISTAYSDEDNVEIQIIENVMAGETVLVVGNEDILEVSIPRYIDISDPSETIETQPDSLNKFISRYKQLPVKFFEREDKAVFSSIFDKVLKVPVGEEDGNVCVIQEVFSADNFKYQLRSVPCLMHCSEEMSPIGVRTFFSFLFCIDREKAFSLTNFDTVFFEKIGMHDPQNQTIIWQSKPSQISAAGFYQVLYNILHQVPENETGFDAYAHFRGLLSKLEDMNHFTSKKNYMIGLFKRIKLYLGSHDMTKNADNIFHYLVQVRRGWKKAGNDFLSELMQFLRTKMPKYWVLLLLTCRLDELYQIINDCEDNVRLNEFKYLCDDQIELVQDNLDYIYEQLNYEHRDSYIDKVNAHLAQQPVQSVPKSQSGSQNAIPAGLLLQPETLCNVGLIARNQMPHTDNAQPVPPAFLIDRADEVETIQQKFIRLHSQLPQQTRQTITQEAFVKLFDNNTFSVANFKQCLKSSKDLNDCCKQMSFLETQVFVALVCCQDYNKVFSWTNFDKNFIDQIGLNDRERQKQFREDASLSGFLKGALNHYLEQYNKQSEMCLINQSIFTVSVRSQELSHQKTPATAEFWDTFS